MNNDKITDKKIFEQLIYDRARAMGLDVQTDENFANAQAQFFFACAEYVCDYADIGSDISKQWENSMESFKAETEKRRSKLN